MIARRRWSMLLLVIVLAACAPAEPASIPAPVELPTLTLSPTRITPPTLPPTWTPVIPSETPAPSQAPAAALPAAIDYLIYVADGAIQRVTLESGEVVAMTGAMAARDLALSPDGRQVAFVGAGAGSGSEVYVLDLRSAFLQKASSLGFADVVDPAWRSDGTQLVFAAGQFMGQEREIYTVGPDGLNQERRTTLARIGLSDPVFTPDGRGLVFAGPGLHSLDLASGAIQPLTIESGWGNDTSPRWRPGSDELIYIRPERDTVGYPGGSLRVITLAEANIDREPPMLANLYVQAFAFSADGQRMVFTSNFSVNLYDFNTRTARRLLETGAILPLAAIAPDGERIAYLGPNVDGGDVPQVVIVNAIGREPFSVTDVSAAVVTDLLWTRLEGQ